MQLSLVLLRPYRVASNHPHFLEEDSETQVD